MKLLTVFNTVVLFLTTCVLSNKAPKVKKNPTNIVAVADFPFGGNKDVKGNVVFTASQGKYVNVHVDMTGFPEDCGPFYYHIHERSVPENGNCEACGLHFNPYEANADCSSQKNDGYCQVGDLSGKHGVINSTCYDAKYTDEFLSLNKKSKSYIVGKSVVFHYPNMTKLACADIELANDLRIQSLIDDYIQSDDTVQINELKQLSFADQDYHFDELEALSMETYDNDPEGETATNVNINAADDNDKGGSTLKNLIQDVKILPQKLVNKTKNHWSKQDEDEFEKTRLERIRAQNLYKQGEPKSTSKLDKYQNYSNVSVHGISSDCANNAGSISILDTVFGGFITALFAVILL
ncbi:hypothetical protein KGF56_003481 [Candida oxycetoniae]|uniref:superoxide dismutase n=1 Tax=Candida oxycetoniae TaxID=497107 RepID=A0AAI9SVC6_9ASCO|nr:uncharacterized protein KGF56_003481 [Candida oxycetoniae]KAI3403756.2 hypothetical protein KGF56_003481 [Candida oxycetoniae]